MGNGIAFRVGSIPVRIDPSFVLVALFVGFTGRSIGLILAWVIVVFVSVLVHELGHAVLFQRFGRRPQIVIQGFGGVTSAPGGLTPSRDLVVSLAGPVTGMVLIGLPALLLSRSSIELSPTAHQVVTDVVWINVLWSVVNLLPVLPLDGGRVTAAVFSLATGGRGMRPAQIVSIVVAGAAGLYALVNGYLFGAVFAGFFVAMNVNGLKAGAPNAPNVPAGHLGEGWVALSQGDTQGSAEIAQKLLAGQPTGAPAAAATELLAWSRLVGGDPAGAAQALEQFPAGFAPDPFLYAALDLDAGRDEAALNRLVQGYASGRFGPANQALAHHVGEHHLSDRLADRLLAPGGPGPAAAGQFATHLHSARHYEDAIAVGSRAFAAANPATATATATTDAGLARDHAAQIAYNLACSAARLDRTELALAWLDRAASLGFADTSLLNGDTDLDGIRTLPDFHEVQKRVAQAARAGPPS